MSVSGHSVILRKINLPVMTREELDESIQWEAEQYIPFDINDVNIDVSILNDHNDQGQMDVLLVAAKKDMINDYINVVREAGLIAHVVDVDSFAVQNAFEINYNLPVGETVALINVGASPFLYWWSRIPSNPFFTTVIDSFLVTGLLFLLLLNPLLLRLTAMLPDETLRMETKLFTSLNRTILTTVVVMLAAYLLMIRIAPGSPEKLIIWLLKTLPLPHQAQMVFYFIDRAGLWLMLFPVLFPIAMTMALIWKIKEIILASVFGTDQH